jgi:hypothetical protein
MHIIIDFFQLDLLFSPLLAPHMPQGWTTQDFELPATASHGLGCQSKCKHCRVEEEGRPEMSEKIALVICLIVFTVQVILCRALRGRFKRIE